MYVFSRFHRLANYSYPWAVRGYKVLIKKKKNIAYLSGREWFHTKLGEKDEEESLLNLL